VLLLLSFLSDIAMSTVDYSALSKNADSLATPADTGPALEKVQLELKQLTQITQQLLQQGTGSLKRSLLNGEPSPLAFPEEDTAVRSDSIAERSPMSAFSDTSTAYDLAGLGNSWPFGGASTPGQQSPFDQFPYLGGFGSCNLTATSQRQTAQSAAGTLASYMSQHNIGALDENTLYQLSVNPDQGTPQAVSLAATFMLQNPKIYQQIETHDVAGADGISGIGNFQWASEGGLTTFGRSLTSPGNQLPPDLWADDGDSSAPKTKPASELRPSPKSSNSKTSSTIPNLSSTDPSKAIANDLEQRYGLTATQVAGVLGNLQQESGLESNVNQGGKNGAPSTNFADDNGHGWGVAQWGGSRKEGEIEYANEHNLDPGSLQANIGFMNQELDGPYSKTITDLKKTNNVTSAATVWDEDYEEATDPQMGNRVKYAENFLDEGL
jgi:hypothetical protein